MMHHSLLYVSKSTFPPSDAAEIVGQITATAIAANARTNLTGALVFTGTHFAQILEGSRVEIDKLMTAIGRDLRHTDLTVVERRDYPLRRFPNWSMAYLGPSSFVSRHVLRLIEQRNDAGALRASAWMSELLVEFTKAS